MLTHQLNPNRWSCIATSFAMALDIPVAELIRRIGHDGSEIVSPAKEPAGRRGFHVQECVAVALTLGFAVTPIELFPVSEFEGGHEKVIAFPANATTPDGNWDRLRDHIESSRGVLAGQGSRTMHAVAYECGQLYDPDGPCYPYSQGACEQRHFCAKCLWRLDRIAK